MTKKLLAIGLGAVLSMTAVSAMAGITLTGSNLPANVIVNCNGHPGLFPIPANGSLGPLPYSLVRAMFKAAGTKQISCTFTVNGSTAGTAVMSIGQKNNTMTVYSDQAGAGYNVGITNNGTPVTAPTGPLANLAVTISK